MAFARTPGANAFANPFVSITTPVFETECATYPGHPSKPPVSAKLMIVPLDRRKSGVAASAQKKGAFRFPSSEASQTSSDVQIMLEGRKLAAQFPRISRRPHCCAASYTQRLTA